jgi:hypothetical protein
MAEYVQSLRSIGQALELLKVEDFDLEIEGEAFLVRCSLPRPEETDAGATGQAGLLQHIWGVLPLETRLELNISVTGDFTANDVDLHYSLKDLGRLDEEGKAKRGTMKQMGAPRLSHFLRSVGDYVKQKHGRLQKISRRADSITIEYETPAGEKNEEVLSTAELYELGVRLSMKRADRNRS